MLICGVAYKEIKQQTIVSTEMSLNVMRPPNNETSRLLDIPETIARVLIQISIAENVMQAEHDLVSHYLGADEVDISDQSRHQLKKLDKILSQFKGKSFLNLPEKQDVPPTVCLTINESSVCFMNPGHLIHKCQQKWPELSKTIQQYAYKADNSVETEWHNFIVFYMRMRLNHIQNKGSISTPVVKKHSVAKRLTVIFNHADPFQDLDAYLQEYGFRKDPVLRGWIFTAIYFDYVRLAYKNGYINMALREFLEGVTSQLTDIPEIVVQKNILILLQRYKLIK
jgi:hypothetical protein